MQSPLPLGDASQIVYAIGRFSPGVITLLGTGFAVAPDKIATAFHVVGASDQNLVMLQPRISSLGEYQDTSDSQISKPPVPLTISAADPVRDLCILQAPSGVQITFSHRLSSADTVPPGSPVVTYGFPHASNGRVVLTLQPATVGARILIESQGIKTKHIVINTQTSDGQSGGPVFNATHQHVVAMVLGSYAPSGAGLRIGNLNPAALHQTTHAISAEYLEAML